MVKEDTNKNYPRIKNTGNKKFSTVQNLVQKSFTNEAILKFIYVVTKCGVVVCKITRGLIRTMARTSGKWRV